MTSRRSSDNWLWVAAALSLGISLTRFGPLMLYPFKLFTTWVHECGHAVMTVIVGGRVSFIVIEPNTTGITRSLIPGSHRDWSLPPAISAQASWDAF